MGAGRGPAPRVPLPPLQFPLQFPVLSFCFCFCFCFCFSFRKRLSVALSRDGRVPSKRAKDKNNKPNVPQHAKRAASRNTEQNVPPAALRGAFNVLKAPLVTAAAAAWLSSPRMRTGRRELPRPEALWQRPSGQDPRSRTACPAPVDARSCL